MSFISRNIISNIGLDNIFSILEGVNFYSKNFYLRIAALFGCAITSGLGAVNNDANVKIGQSVLIFGIGATTGPKILSSSFFSKVCFKLIAKLSTFTSFFPLNIMAINLSNGGS